MSENSVYFDFEVQRNFGYVTSPERVNDVIAEFEIANTCKFSNIKKKGNFGKTDPHVGNHMIRWDDRKDATARLPFDGVPFIIGGIRVFDCQHGVDRKASSKVKQIDQQKSLMFQRSKKMNCPAQIIVREILKFPDYKIPEDCSRLKKVEISKEIRSKLNSAVIFERRFYISYPALDEHKNHVTGEYAGMSHPMDKRLVSYVSQLVENGMTDVKCVQRQLRHMVDHVLFPGKSLPALTNQRLFPTTSAIRSQIHRAKRAHRHSKLDQEKVQQLVHKLHDDSIKFRPAVDVSACLHNDGTVTKHTLLFVHQTKWQQRLLQLYGNDVALLDAAHKRTHFTLPLFFVLVKTNLNYQIVASFVTEDESQESITEALSVLSAWNPRWSPVSFMTDYCDEEIHSLENVFPACTVYVSDFHREHAWKTWTTKPDHGVSENKEPLLASLRKLAHSPNITAYNTAVDVLQTDDVWKENSKLRNWFEKTWLTISKKWVWCYREDRLLVALNANDGIKQQNDVLKYCYLQKQRKNTLSQMLTFLCEELLPDNYHEYLLENVRQSNCSDSQGTPEFLRKRPRYFINHCLQESALASAITCDGPAEADHEEDVPSADEDDNCEDEDRLQYEKNLLSDRQYVVGSRELRGLVERARCRQCGLGVAPDSITSSEHRILAGVRFEYTCTAGHHDKWYSTPWYGSISFIGLMLHVSVLLSGMTWQAWALTCQFCNICVGSPMSFFIHQRMFRVGINRYFNSHLDTIRQKLPQGPRAVAVDVRYDTPGFSANKATAIVTDYETGDIVTMTIIYSRSVNRRSSQMEKEGVASSLAFLTDNNLDFNEVVSDASSSVINLMSTTYPEKTHSLDVWHKAKKIRQSLVDAAKPARCKDLRPWIPAVITHFWWSCGNCGNNVSKLCDLWSGILYHVTGVHKWAYGRCRHQQNLPEPGGKTYLEKDSPAYKALRDMVTVLEAGSRSYIVWSSKKDICYSVYIGNETQLPSCGCDVWQSTSLPCKHMFAVFNLVSDMSWYSLPEHYRESSFFKLDLETANRDLEKTSCSHQTESTEEYYCELANVPLNVVDETQNNDAITPTVSVDSKSKMCRSAASRCRDLLKQIAAMTYLVNDQAKLEKLEKDLQVILDNFTAQVQKDDSGNSLADNEPSVKMRKLEESNESS